MNFNKGAEMRCARKSMLFCALFFGQAFPQSAYLKKGESGVGLGFQYTALIGGYQNEAVQIGLTSAYSFRGLMDVMAIFTTHYHDFEIQNATKEGSSFGIGASYYPVKEGGRRPVSVSLSGSFSSFKKSYDSFVYYNGNYSTYRVSDIANTTGVGVWGSKNMQLSPGFFINPQPGLSFVLVSHDYEYAALPPGYALPSAESAGILALDFKLGFQKELGEHVSFIWSGDFGLGNWSDKPEYSRGFDFTSAGLNVSLLVEI